MRQPSAATSHSSAAVRSNTVSDGAQREPVPVRGPPEHVVTRPTEVDVLRRGGDAARLVDEGPGHRRRGDPVASAVPGDEVPTSEMADRVGPLQPRRQGDDADDARVVCDVYGGARAHRVTEHDHRHSGVLLGALVECPPGIRDRRRLAGACLASGVPAADTEAQQPHGEPLAQHVRGEHVAHGRRTPQREALAGDRLERPSSRHRAASARCRGCFRACFRAGPCG